MFVVSARTCQSIDTDYPSKYHIPPAQHQGNFDPPPATFLVDKLVDKEPAQYFRKSHNHFSDPTFTAVATDLGPHDMGSVHPFIFATVHAFLQPTDQLHYCVHERYASPNRQPVVVSGLLGPTIPAEGSESLARYILSFSAWRVH